MYYSNICILLVILVSIVIIDPVNAANVDYEDQSNWSGDWTSGNKQSPINIQSGDSQEKAGLSISVSSPNRNDETLVWDGTKLQVDYDEAELIFNDGDEETKWTSAQFHFHAKSEHHLDGQESDVELHVVFTKQDDSSQYLVLGILFDGDDDAETNEFLDNLNLDSLSDGDNTVNVRLHSLLDSIEGKQMFNYEGSLTTPTCDEGVTWIVLSEPVSVPTEQVKPILDIWPNDSSFQNGVGTDRDLQEDRKSVV